MRKKRIWLGLGLLAALTSQQATAAEPMTAVQMGGLSSPYHARDVGPNGGATDDPSTMVVQVSHDVAAPGYSVGACNTCGTGCGADYCLAGPGVYAPPMIGHFAFPFILKADPVRVIDVRTGEVATSVAREARPLFSRTNSFISTGESPQPMTRAYARYDYLEIKGPFPSLSPLVDKIELQSVTLGFEKACWDDHVSIGVRVPFYKSRFSTRTLEDDGIVADLIQDLDDRQTLGDVTIILKAAMGNYARIGSVCTVGLAATLPTGKDSTAFDLATGVEQDKHIGFLQPFLGYLKGWEGAYVQGFSSLLFPIRNGSGDDAIIWHNSIGLGYWAVGGSNCGGSCGHGNHLGLLSAVVPTLELHVNSALNNGGQFDYFRDPAADNSIFVTSRSNLQFSTTVVVTGGINVSCGDNAWATLGAAVPLTEQPFDYQLVAQINIKF